MKTPLHLLLCFLWISLTLGNITVNEYRFFDFEWKNEEQRNKTISSGGYDPAAVVPIDVHMEKETFLAIPRTTATPASLVTVKGIGTENALLVPYPDWSWTGLECNKSIISTYRVASDKCGRLWVLDNGQIGETQVCPPKIVAFQLSTRKMVLMKVIPNEYAFNKQGKGLLVTPIVKTSGRNCERLTMYIADIVGYGLIVWDGKNKFKRFESEAFTAPNPDFTLNNVSFHLEDGLAGLALNTNFLHKSRLYFSALASYKMYHVSTREITVDSDKTPNYIEDKGNVHERRVPLVIKKNTMYFCSLESNTLYSWDIRTEFSQENLKPLWKDVERLQFVSGLKISTEGPSSYIYGISNKYQKTAANIRNMTEYNFHIFMYDI